MSGDRCSSDAPELRPVAENEWWNLVTGEVLDDAQVAEIRARQAVAAQKHGPIESPLEGWPKVRPETRQAGEESGASLPLAPAAERTGEAPDVPDDEAPPQSRPSRAVDEAPGPGAAASAGDKPVTARGAAQPHRLTDGDGSTAVEKLDRVLDMVQGLERSWRAQTADMDRWKRSLKARGRMMVIASRACLLTGGLIAGAGTQYMLGSWVAGGGAVADRIERYGESIAACEARLKGHGPGHFCGVTVFRQQ